MNLLKILSSTMLLATTIFAKDYAIVVNNSNAQFTLKYQKTKDINGVFKNISGNIDYDERTNVIKSIKGEIKVNSIDTLNDDLDALIMSNKILNSDKFPNISFVATKIEENKVFGDLIIKGVKRNIELELENSGVFLDRLYLNLQGKIKRSYFDISWDELLDIGSSVTSNEIKIAITIEADLVDKFYLQNKNSPL